MLKAIPLGTVQLTEISPYWQKAYAQTRILNKTGNIIRFWDTNG